MEHIFGGARLSLTTTTTPATNVRLKGFDADRDAIEESAPALEQVNTPATVDEVAVPEPSTIVQVGTVSTL